MAARFVLHHHPQSRAQRIKWLLEEAGAPYEIVSHDLEAGTHKKPDFLELNPDGKLPTLIDRGPGGSWSTVVTESSAIVIHVADAVPGAGLAPGPSDPRRGAYLNWIAYVSAAAEPALADHVWPRAEAAPATAIGWPPYEKVMNRIAAGVSSSPYLTGDAFTGADLMVGSMLNWLSGWGKLPGPERFEAYLERLKARPAFQRAAAQ
ncbi:glutathione S-transferase family protein [Hansschlegelia zhihuaiae]|uniref:Glutathione S-transferase family protein n=1 Tax=Hansschlegelia zhihuaiae TaxID=405005 RepID=A0A4V1KII2_9HYPH|nr:glutathione S-transferase family protein [Hansschlegelia zhihuaiae]RXF70782.1 glutathione S-transferase family protein [Hansschlegelia zhihuaiae]